MRLLIVEDDIRLAGILSKGFGEHGIEATHVTTMAAGRSQATLGTFDVLLLDVMLPGGSGVDLCRDLRREGCATPILMLTARDTVRDRVQGLDAGADDYLTKPFAFSELLARVRALLRRRPAFESRVVQVADLAVDLSTRQVTRGGRALELTSKEFALLEGLALHAGEVVDRIVLSAHVWDDNHNPFNNVLEVLLHRLRRKIDDDFEPKLVQTVRGAGYRLGV